MIPKKKGYLLQNKNDKQQLNSFEKKKPSLVLKGQNWRDTANTIEWTVLANMKAYNSQLISKNLCR